MGRIARAGSSPAFGTKNYNIKKCFEFSFSHINYDDDMTTEELYIIPLETNDNPYEYILDCEVINTESGHRIDNFEEYVSLIENYLL